LQRVFSQKPRWSQEQFLNTHLDYQVDLLTGVEAELQEALRHCQTAREHFGTGEVPRACAHTLALEGNLLAIHNFLKEVKLKHSEMAT